MQSFRLLYAEGHYVYNFVFVFARGPRGKKKRRESAAKPKMIGYLLFGRSLCWGGGEIFSIST